MLFLATIALQPASLLLIRLIASYGLLGRFSAILATVVLAGLSIGVQPITASVTPVGNAALAGRWLISRNHAGVAASRPDAFRLRFAAAGYAGGLTAPSRLLTRTATATSLPGILAGHAGCSSVAWL
jgi:hypothetical protein